MRALLQGSYCRVLTGCRVRRELWDEYFKLDLEIDFDAAPNMIDGQVLEKGWRRRQAEAEAAELKAEHPDWTDRQVLVELERRGE